MCPTRGRGADAAPAPHSLQEVVLAQIGEGEAAAAEDVAREEPDPSPVADAVHPQQDLAGAAGQAHLQGEGRGWSRAGQPFLGGGSHGGAA